MDTNMVNKMLEVKKALDNNSGKDNIVQMLDLLNKSNLRAKSETKEIEEKLPKKDILEEINTPSIKTIKSCIPYLEEKYQKNVALFIKVIELQTLMDKYQEVAIQNRSSNKNWKKGMLLAIKSNMGEEQKKKADMIIQMLELQDVFKLMQGNNENKENEEGLNNE